MMSPISSNPKIDSRGSASLSSIPSAGWIALLVVGIALIVLFSTSTPAPVPVSNPVVPLPPASAVPTPPADAAPILPSDLYVLSLSPGSPLAGNDVTLTGMVKSGYENVPGVFPFELGARQFGNWQTVSCDASPCTLVISSVSTGTLEYRAIRFVEEGGSLIEFLDGQYSVDVASTGTTGDTLGPKVVVFFDPAKPKAGGDVEVTSSVEDISSLDKVEIYVNGTLEKTCPQKVKIAHCKVILEDLDAGTYTYYSKAWDSFGNLTTSPESSFVVEVE
ncbi:MAG: hypothetical protein AABW68_04340 [archaeon]